MTELRSEKKYLTAVMIETPLGWVTAAATGDMLISVTLPQPTRERAQAALHEQGTVVEGNGGENYLLTRFAFDLPRYFAGERVDFSAYPVDLSSYPPFVRAALQSTRSIPYGEVRSYTWVAAQAGNSKAVRAAGQAMHHNPLPLVIPCHRVVGRNGALTGFGGGLEMKRILLKLEGVTVHAQHVLPDNSNA